MEHVAELQEPVNKAMEGEEAVPALQVVAVITCLMVLESEYDLVPEGEGLQGVTVLFVPARVPYTLTGKV